MVLTSVNTATTLRSFQIGYFKLTHGKRFFKMAPLHHHFELCGWSEWKIVIIATAISTVFCLLAYFGVVGRYI